MIKIITFSAHPNPYKSGGIVEYCRALEKLFDSDKKINLHESEIIPHNTPLGAKYNKRQIRNYLEQSSPDIIHLNGYTSLLIQQLVPIAKKKGIKIVYTPHWHPFHTMRSPFLKKLYFQIFIKPYLKNMDAIVCINGEDYDYFKKFSDRVYRIPHWIDFDKLPFTKKERVSNQILFVGSLMHPNKRFRYLYNLPKDKYRIICVGRGDLQLRSDMTHLYRILETELAELYSQSSLVVIPSNYEAFSYVAMEALNAGTPVVMSDRVRIADYLPNFDGIKIFNLDSPELFISAVDEMIGRKFDNKIVKELFSTEKALKNYTCLYTSVFGE